jgi:hypothetical protein
MPGWALSKLRDFTTGTGEISRKYIMYISLNVWDSLKELDKFVMDVYDNILNGKKSDEGMTKQFADRVFKLQRLLRNELGIKELLDTMPLPNETLIKMQHEAEIKNEQ